MSERNLVLPDNFESYFPVEPWDHQRRAIPAIINRLHNSNALTVCMPTGAGKSNVTTGLLNIAASQNLRAIVFTNRKLLTRQTAAGLSKHGIDFGVRAASMPAYRQMDASIQVSSMQTEIARCLNGSQDLFNADIVFVDEAHLMANGGSLKVLQNYMAMGAKIVLVTATPVGLNHIAKDLYVGATCEELRRCGAHVPAIIKSVHEMDLSRVRRVKESDDMGNQQMKYNLQDIRENAWSQAIVGNVLNDYKLFNPDRRMAMGVAPGVPESRALCLYFNKCGIRAAHIDAKEVYIDGEFKADNSLGERRHEIIEQWKDGRIDVVWTCQVLREGIDLPELYHLILATPILSLKDWVQTCGRVIRKSAATPDHVLITDHGGGAHRHGSPNSDQDWHHLYNMTEAEISEMQDRRKKDKPDEMPAACPKCGTLVGPGRKCPPEPIGCGEPIEKTNPRKLRFVVQQTGKLVEFKDDFKPKRKPSTSSQEQKQWDRLFWAARNSKSERGQNFNQLRGAYLRAHGKYPPDNLTNMPKDKSDWGRRVRDVSTSGLSGYDASGRKISVDSLD